LSRARTTKDLNLPTPLQQLICRKFLHISFLLFQLIWIRISDSPLQHAVEVDEATSELVLLHEPPAAASPLQPNSPRPSRLPTNDASKDLKEGERSVESSETAGGTRSTGGAGDAADRRTTDESPFPSF